MPEAPKPLPQQSAPRKVLRLDSLTGLRWWAAFGVFAYHFQNVGHFRGSALAAIGYTGSDEPHSRSKFCSLCMSRNTVVHILETGGSGTTDSGLGGDQWSPSSPSDRVCSVCVSQLVRAPQFNWIVPRTRSRLRCAARHSRVLRAVLNNRYR